MFKLNIIVSIIVYFLVLECNSLKNDINIENEIYRKLDNYTDIKVEFYDLYTNDTFLRFPFRQRRQPCQCDSYNCGCCAGMNIQAFNFNQKLCTNFEYDPNKFQMSMNIMMNDNQLYQNMFSARDPPPVCIPIPVPYIPVMADMCLKFFNIFMPGRNMHMCMDMETRLQRQPILVLHFDCMRMGQDGIALVKPEDNGGLPVDGPATHIDVNNPDPPPDVVEPPQTDYDIYDQVDEIKHRH